MLTKINNKVINSKNNSDMCRICMMPSERLKDKNVITYELTTNICDMLNTCSQINAEIHDYLPQKICIACYRQLNETIMFITLVKQSNTSLRNCLNVINNLEKSKEINEDKTENKRLTRNDTKSNEILKAVGLVKVEEIKQNKNSHKFKCKECFKKFVWAEPYKRHMANQHSVSIYQCKTCGEKFSSRRNLEEHKNETHSGRKPYCCTECKIHFKTLENLTVHIRKIHVGQLPFSCKICKEEFETKGLLESHMATHKKKTITREKSFNCESCDKKFAKNSALVRHTRVHTKEKPYICKICNAGFQQQHNLTKHMVRHNTDKEFSCEICQKQFGRNDSLARHMLVHSIKKPHSCHKCNKTFTRISQLQAHVASNHPGDILIQTQ